MGRQNLKVEVGLKEDEIMRMLFGENVGGLATDSFDGSWDEHRIFMEVFYGANTSEASHAGVISKVPSAEQLISSYSSTPSESSDDFTSSDPSEAIFSLPMIGSLHASRHIPCRIVESFGHGILSSYYFLNSEKDTDSLCHFNNLAEINGRARQNAGGKTVLGSNSAISPISQDMYASEILPFDGVSVIKQTPEQSLQVNQGELECSFLGIDTVHITQNKDFFKDLPGLLESHSHSLLIDVGWKIEPRKRSDRDKPAFFFTDPDDGQSFKALTQAWKACGKKLFAEAVVSEQDKLGMEWADINSFWSDLVDVLSYIEKEIQLSESSISLLYRWKLLDPFMAVVWIDKRIGALRAGKALKAVDSATVLLKGEKCDDLLARSIVKGKDYIAENYSPSISGNSRGNLSVFEFDIKSPDGDSCNHEVFVRKSGRDPLKKSGGNGFEGNKPMLVTKGKSLQSKRKKKDILSSKSSLLPKGSSLAFPKGYLSNKTSKPCATKRDELSISEKFLDFGSPERMTSLVSCEHIVESVTSSEPQLPACQEITEGKVCAFGNSGLGRSSSRKRIHGSIRKPPKKSRKTTEIDVEAIYEDMDSEQPNLDGIMFSSGRDTGSQGAIYSPQNIDEDINLESILEKIHPFPFSTIYPGNNFRVEKLFKHTKDNVHATPDDESAPSKSAEGNDKAKRLASNGSVRKGTSLQKCRSKFNMVKFHDEFQESGEYDTNEMEPYTTGDLSGVLDMETLLHSEPSTSPKSIKSKKYEVPKENGRKKSRGSRIYDDDLLISAIIKNKDFGCGVKRHSKLDALKHKSLVMSCTQKRSRKLQLRAPWKGGKPSDGKRFLLGARTVLCWLIKKGVLSLNDIVQYRNPKNNAIVKDGQVTFDGILCRCCTNVFSMSEFKTHGGSRQQRSSMHLFLQSGKPLVLCQLQAWSIEYKRRVSTKVMEVEELDQNDDTCGLCGDGGELICCDNCPSTYHQACLPEQELPEDSWYCSNCICTICKEVVNAKDVQHTLSSLQCQQCEHKYHMSCLKKYCTYSEVADSQEWFCGMECQEVYIGLRSRIGLMNSFGDGFSWRILRCSHSDRKVQSAQKFAIVAECNTRLAISLILMEECFLPMVDTRTGMDMIPHVLYNMGSNFARLNYQGFYTIVLEKDDKLISVASIRVHGVRVAEMPLVATCSEHRRQGMCTRLMNAIEELLKSFKVKMLVLSAIPSLVDTWTSGFGFSRVGDDDRKQFCDVNLMLLPGTVLLQKTLCGSVDKLSGNAGLNGDFHSKFDSSMNLSPSCKDTDTQCSPMSSKCHGPTCK